MQEKYIRQLLKKFMDGETSLDEERTIAKWFHENPPVSSDLEDYRAMFEWFDAGMLLDDGKEPVLAENGNNGRTVPMKHRRWLLPVIGIAAAGAVVLGIALSNVWNQNDGQKQGYINIERPQLAVNTAKDSAGNISSSQADRHQGINADTIKSQNAYKKRTGRRKARRVRYEPVPPPLIYAQIEDSAENAVRADNPLTELNLAMNKANEQSPVTDETEAAIDAELEKMERDQQLLFYFNSLRNALYEQSIISSISDDEEVY